MWAAVVARSVGAERRGEQSPRPRIYYGWKIVGVLALTETISWGIVYYAFSVFIQPMQREFGWSQAAITGAYSLSLLVSGLAGILVGRILDVRGPRLVMSLGSVLAVALVFAWSQVQSLPAFYLIWIGLGAAMAGILYEPAFAVIATWFARRRRRALTVLTLVGGFASVIFIPLAEQLVQAYGWRGALLILGGTLGITTILPHILVLRKHPSDMGLTVDGTVSQAEAALRPVPPELTTRDALEDRAFWWLTGAFALNAFVVVALTLHLIPYLIEHHYSSTFAANAAGLVGLMVVPGRIIFSVVGDRVPRKGVTIAIFVLVSISLMILHWGSAVAAVMAFVVLFGASKGAITPVRAAVVADDFGASNYASISGVMLFPSTITRALAPVAVGFMFDQAGNYDLVMWLMIGLSLFAVLMLGAVQRNTLPQTSVISLPIYANEVQDSTALD